jgi:hypothetical protein
MARTESLKALEEHAKTVLQVNLADLGALTGETAHFVNRLIKTTMDIATDPDLTDGQKAREFTKAKNTFSTIREFQEIGINNETRQAATAIIGTTVDFISRIITGVIDRYLPPAPPRA